MKQGLWFPILLVLLALSVLLAFTMAEAQIPRKISYQGLLTTAVGTPITDGTYSFRFDLYDSLAGGASQWTETQNNDSVQRGTFSAILGSVTPLNLAFNRI